MAPLLFYVTGARIMLHRLFCGWRKQAPVLWRTARVLCVGLDGAGKSTLLRTMAAEGVPQALGGVEPTSGFNCRTVTVPPDSKLEMWDLGGSSATREFWSRYATGATGGLVWVVDGADAARLAESGAALKALLARAPVLLLLPLLVLVNKAELPGAQSADAVGEALGLKVLPRTAPLLVQPCSAADGRNVEAAMSWLAAAALGGEATGVEMRT